MNAPNAAFTLSLPVLIRVALESDLEQLEWFGEFRAHREIILSAFAAQLRGDGAMLIADCQSFPVGQVWIDFRVHASQRAGYIWAFRVIPWMQRLGLGTHLLGAAEASIEEHDLSAAVLNVEPENANSRRFFERRGYREEGRQMDEYSYRTPEGEQVEVCQELVLLRKELGIHGGGA